MDQGALLIIPTFNEADNLQAIVKAVWDSQPNLRILVVDDNSTDGTAEIIEQLRVEHPEQFFSLHRASKQGLGTAYIAGFKWAMTAEPKVDVCIEMDADFSHNPKVLPVIIERLKSVDVVIGSRYIDGGGTTNWSLGRKLISRFGSFYARMILNVKVRDLTGGFNGWRLSVLAAIDLDDVRSEGYSFQIELKYRAIRRGFSVEEVPIIFSERRAGQSKMSSRIVVEAMFRVWQLRFLIPSANRPSRPR